MPAAETQKSKMNDKSIIFINGIIDYLGIKPALTKASLNSL